MGLEIPERYVDRLEGPIGLPDEACTTDVNVQDFWSTKQAAVRCHATQLNPDSVFALLPPEIMRDLQAWECFQLAESRVGEDEGCHDLFAGLR
jgi:mycothiol S-conjugate amidase